ncbi:MAG: hypothetical protein R3253_10670, partial [Longimicrobiales bacterium]|nr:hypothetical protein [Longimicrobiales bacterium]
PPEEPSPPPPSTPPPGPPPEDTVPRYPEPEELSVFGKRVLRKLEGAAEINRLRSILTNIWGRGSNPRKMLLEVFKGEAGVFGIGDLRRLADSGLVGNPGHRSWIEEVLARAQGGPTSSGKLYLVGEEGPELFRPRASGQVIPLGALERFGDMAAPQEGGASAEVSEALRELGSALSELSRRQGEDKEKTDKAIQQMSEDLRQMTSRMNRVLSLLEGQVAVR